MRLGTPAVTTRGMREPEMQQIAGWIVRVLRSLQDEAVLAEVRREVQALTARFPLPQQTGGQSPTGCQDHTFQSVII